MNIIVGVADKSWLEFIDEHRNDEPKTIII